MPSLDGALVLERNTRAPGDEDFGAPVLLSPRNTSLLNARPEIVWTSVQGAIEYEIHVAGSSGFCVLLDASKAPCNRSGDDWGEEKVCSLPWPASVPDLPYGGTVFLSLGARHGPASPLRAESEPSRIQRLTEERAEEVRASLERLRDLPLTGEARHLLEADVYVRAGEFSVAIPAYRKAPVFRDAPEGRITLGDLYFTIGLLRLAAMNYQEALKRSEEGGIQAAAEFGLGRVEYASRSFERAIEHFRRSRSLYDSVGLKNEAETAGRAEETARSKAGNEAQLTYPIESTSSSSCLSFSALVAGAVRRVEDDSSPRADSRSAHPLQGDS